MPSNDYNIFIIRLYKRRYGISDIRQVIFSITTYLVVQPSLEALS